MSSTLSGRNWKASSERAKARAIQDEASGLNFREVEQAVIATFLHSQPVGHRASLRDVTLLVSPTRPDKIQLEKGLLRWAELSHFLDDQFTSEANPKPDGKRDVPKFWRLGSKPKLKQMHSDACDRIQPELVEAKLLKTIEGIKSLREGTSGAGFKVMFHLLPDKPSDVKDDGEFHFAVLGPKAASTSGNPSAEARRFLDETTAADRPRVNRNAVVLAVPSKDGLEVARARIKDYLAWEAVQSQLKEQKVEDPIRLETVITSLDSAKKAVPKAVQVAHNLIVTVAAANEIQAFKLNIDTSKALFEQIRDRSFRTTWRQDPSAEDLKNPALEAVLPVHAELSQIDRSLLAPHSLPALWQGDEITVATLKGYFSGGRVVKLPREGYEEPVVIPKAGSQVVEQAVLDAVKAGTLWLTSGPTSLLAQQQRPGGDPPIARRPLPGGRFPQEGGSTTMNFRVNVIGISPVTGRIAENTQIPKAEKKLEVNLD
jgi:hypothetical protein